MDFILVTVLIAMAVAAWVVVVRVRTKHASDDEMAGWLPRRRHGGRQRMARHLAARGCRASVIGAPADQFSP